MTGPRRRLLFKRHLTSARDLPRDQPGKSPVVVEELLVIWHRSLGTIDARYKVVGGCPFRLPATNVPRSRLGAIYVIVSSLKTSKGHSN
jgi:hypothetical protein